MTSKDKIDRIIDAVLENSIVDNVYPNCVDGYPIVDDFKNQHHPESDYDRCRAAIKKILEATKQERVRMLICGECDSTIVGPEDAIKDIRETNDTKCCKNPQLYWAWSRGRDTILLETD